MTFLKVRIKKDCWPLMTKAEGAIKGESENCHKNNHGRR